VLCLLPRHLQVTVCLLLSHCLLRLWMLYVLCYMTKCYCAVDTYVVCHSLLVCCELEHDFVILEDEIGLVTSAHVLILPYRH